MVETAAEHDLVRQGFRQGDFAFPVRETVHIDQREGDSQCCGQGLALRPIIVETEQHVQNSM